MRVNIKEVEENVSKLAKKSSFDIGFVYELLLAYGKPPASITRLKSGTYNLAIDKANEIYWKNILFFRYVEHDDLHSTIDDLKGNQFVNRHNPRFIIVTDFEQLLAIDTKTQETLDIPLNEIEKHFVFFLPWAGMEKSQHKTENIADVKAAERMAKLYDEIIKHNESTSPAFFHALNVFFSRLLFCFFAEDTEVFTKGQFTDSIASHTQPNGSDLNTYLDELFKALDVEDKTNYPSHIKAFPYVNGGLFNRSYESPKFNTQARKLILECGELDWAQINPDIFGSMIQAVVHPGQRAGLGMHYTSVVNIMKVIEPLFLEALHEELDKAGTDEKKLGKLLHRIYAIKVFDPACGSGNFLIIAYKELRKIEHQILEILLADKLAGIKIGSNLKLENFYGIEIDDFAHEVAILSLWLAKHQMNIEFKQKFGKDIPLIPLKDTGNIANANAALVDWEAMCRIDQMDEAYLIGNPPYIGSKYQKDEHKKDMFTVLGGLKNYKVLDYISLWFYKGSRFIMNHPKSKLAFVSTNSICQGDQVAIFWPHILDNLEIGFAHRSFKWTNNAKKNAGVTCSIISLRQRSGDTHQLFHDGISETVSSINAYLATGSQTIVYRRKKPLFEAPSMSAGNYTGHAQQLTLTRQEKDELLGKHPEAIIFIKKLLGSDEFIKGTERWCLWIPNDKREIAESILPIKNRIEEVRRARLETKDKSANKLAVRPHQFRDIKETISQSIIIPIVSSERRIYIPVGFVDKDTIVTNKVVAIYDAEPYMFGLVSSSMHMSWVRAVSGRLETRISYSSEISYNTFPFPKISEKQKQMITNHVFEVLDIRERYPETTLAYLYDPETMPPDLMKAHRELDIVVELCYRQKPFDNEEERLAYLLKLYETMITTQKELI